MYQIFNHGNNDFRFYKARNDAFYTKITKNALKLKYDDLSDHVFLYNTTL